MEKVTNLSFFSALLVTRQMPYLLLSLLSEDECTHPNICQLKAGAVRLCGGQTPRLHSSGKFMLSGCWASTPLLDTLALTSGALLVVGAGVVLWASLSSPNCQYFTLFSFQPSFLQMKLFRPWFPFPANMIHRPNVVPMLAHRLQSVAQHKSNIGSMSCACWVALKKHDLLLSRKGFSIS